MEPAGLAIGIVGLAGQLAKVSRECYSIFSEMNEIGNAHGSVLHDLRREGLRLKRWEHAWGLGDTSSQQIQHLDPSDERYRFAVASLARIVAVFTKVAELQARYQGEPEKDDHRRKRDSLGFGRLVSRFRSKSPHPGTSNDSHRPTSPSPRPSISGLNPGDLSLLENPMILTNKQLLPGINEEIASLTRIAQNIQQSVPTYHKLRWASIDKTKCEDLVGQLTKHINGLFDVLPPDATIPQSQATVPRMSRTRSLNLSFDIPFSLPETRRNSDFIGREYLLEKLKREIEEGAAKTDITQVVLYGMGGMGKTQLALEYIYRHSGDYSSVFWINAASEQTTKIGFTHIMQRLIKHHAKLSDEPDYTQIGRLLGMAGKLDSTGMFSIQQPSEEQHVVDAVKDWLTTKDNTKWLLIFDNLDDVESFDVNDYIPLSAHGTVIITSRRRESVQGRRGLEVQQMDNDEAEQLLFKSSKPDFSKLTLEECEREKEAAARIVQKLEYMPLAIDQAGACIHVCQYSFSRYLQEYDSEVKITHLLSKKWKVGKHDRSVFAAWDLSFKAIQKQNPKAAELLLLCGFIDNNDICEEFLQRGMKLPKDDATLGDSIQTLSSYSMVKRQDGDDSFSIHPLIHIWTQWRLKMEPEKHTKKATEAFLMVASAIDIPVSKREVKDWVFERRILPHIIAVERQMKTLAENEAIPGAIDSLRKDYLLYGYYRKAKELCKVILAGREKALGAGHTDTLTTVNNMALVFYQQGQYNKALELYERALAGREKALGADHPDTLGTVNNMALVFKEQGQYNKALELYERALAGREKALGADHPEILATVNNMALVFYQQGQYNKALELYGRALAGYEKALGEDHPATLTTVENMASVFERQAQYNKALELYERVLVGKEKALGADHPETLATVQNMALVFYHQGQYNKALELYERALAGYEKALGADHPSTLTVVHNMALVIERQGQYNKALELYERALAGREKALGADHPDTLGTVNNMALVFNEQGQYNKALELYKRALAGREKALGADHPDTLATVHNMALVFYHQGQYNKALELYERALAGYEKALGADHPSTLIIISNMANLFAQMGLLNKAMDFWERASTGASTNASK
ncbi:hypothetical protein BDZ91DRAFT_487124 [Kalaharituber pfeilii]|nr:hypothetical protein BDZ91DRAFT_487124 [Kalaharituber pfeilii]